MSNPFAMKKFREDGLSIICLEGYLDAHTAPQFEEGIQEEIEASHFRIIVDCQKLEYVSSAGLGVFMGFVEEVREAQGDIKICGLTSRLREVFDILGFPDIFDLLDDIPAARQCFSSGAGKGAARGDG